MRDDQVTFLIATGTHRLQSDELNRRLYGSGMIDRFRFVCHVCTDDSSLVSLGMLPSGYEFVLNRLAVEADYLITLGVVSPHYFAGYSGGRKSILPGICGKRRYRTTTPAWLKSSTTCRPSARIPSASK